MVKVLATMHTSDWLMLLMVVATLMLAAVALFQEKFQSWRCRPVLTVGVAPLEATTYRSIRVSNEKGKGPAYDVEEIALRVNF